MHSAPWTKASSSTSVCRRMAAICAIESSRGSTTRRTPSDSTSRMHSALLRVICVEACSGSSGQSRWISRSSAEVLHEHGIDARRDGQPRGPLGLLQFVAEDQRVERQIALDAAGAEERHQFGQFGRGEVRRPRPGVETALQAEVDGVGPVFDRRPRAVPIAGRGHQLRRSWRSDRSRYWLTDHRQIALHTAEDAEEEKQDCQSSITSYFSASSCFCG